MWYEPRMERSIRVILNKAALRTGRATLVPGIETAFAGVRLDLCVPASYEEAFALAASCVTDGYGDLVVVGGDGTVNLAVNASYGTGVRLGIIPRGSANDLATYLEIPRDLATACDIILWGHTRKLDLIEVNGKFYATAGGIGVVSRVARRINRFKAASRLTKTIAKIFGSTIYLLYGVCVLIFSKRLWIPVDVSCDGKLVGQFSLVALFINNEPTIGKWTTPRPDARPDDGEMSGVLLKRRSRLGTILTVGLMSLKGSHTQRKDAISFSGGTIEVKAARPVTFIGDGEVLVRSDLLKLQVHPGALKVLSPYHSG